MRPPMGVQLTRSHVTRATYFALVRFLTGINALMDRKLSSRSEAFDAYITFVRFLSGMPSFMGLQAGALRERHLA